MKKDLPQQQGEARAKYHLEEIKKKFCNLLMRNGEKSKATSLFIQCLNLLEKKSLLFKNQKNHYMEKHTSPKVSPKVMGVKTLYSTEEDQNTTHIPERSILCENKNPLLYFYTLYDSAEKNGSFEKNTTLYDYSTDNKSENRHQGIEDNYYNNFLKNNILYMAIENVKCPLELRKVRKGSTTYQVPAIVSQKRQERLAIKWIIESASKRKNKKKICFYESLYIEILEAFNKTGPVRQKRDEILKIAEFNRAYTLYRWW